MFKISVITPVYNNVNYIRACMDSFIDQHCPDAEHVIVDGGSTDGTAGVIREYAARHPHIQWISQKDSGQSDAMNKGIRMARGPVISFLNVDDYYEPGVFNRVLPLFEGLPEPSLVVGHCNIWHDDGSLIRVNRPHHLNILDLLLLKGEFPLNPSSYFYHKSLHDTIGLYNVEEHYNLDVEFIYDAVQHAHVVQVAEVWGNFCMLKGSKTKEMVLQGNYWKNYYQFREKYVQRLPPAVRCQYYALQTVEKMTGWAVKRYRSLHHYGKRLLRIP